MDHSHLTPEEIDLLIDSSAGYVLGTGLNTDAISSCAECRARIGDARAIIDVLEDLPRLAPSHKFADGVMSQVPVFVPWWVSLRDSVKPWIPVSQPARIGLGVLATAAASAISVVFLWVLTQTDALAALTGAAGNRVQELFAQGLQALAAAVLGEGALGAIQQRGPVGVALAITGIVILGGLTVFGFRRLATVSGRRRATVASGA